MKSLTILVLSVALPVALAGCKKAPAQDSALPSTEPVAQAPTPEGQIRTAIEAHLAHNTNLNLKAFDMDVKQVNIQGDHAQAQVDFRVKGGPGAMELTYQLENHEGNWAVIESNAIGSNFSHPSTNQAAPAAGAMPFGGASHSLADTLRSFKVQPGGGSSSLPPGHPPITTNSAAATQ